MPPFLGFGGHGRVSPPPMDPPVQPIETNQTNQTTSIVSKFVDMCGRRHPVVNNFPLSHVILKVNFPLSNDPNESLSQVKDLKLSWAMNSSGFNNLATRVA